MSYHPSIFSFKDYLIKLFASYGTFCRERGVGRSAKLLRPTILECLSEHFIKFHHVLYNSFTVKRTKKKEKTNYCFLFFLNLQQRLGNQLLLVARLLVPFIIWLRVKKWNGEIYGSIKKLIDKSPLTFFRCLYSLCRLT